jgi:hypothetical protein
MRCAWVAAAVTLAGASAAQVRVCEFQLSRVAPTRSCPLPPQAPTVADIPVRPEVNPTSAPISLRIEFNPTSGPPIRLGAASLYPVNQSQTFAVRLPRKPGRLAVTLIPDPRPVTVAVGPIRWRYIR